MTDSQIRDIVSDITRHRAEAFATAFLAITTAAAADVLAHRLGSALATHAAIVGKVQSDADAVQLADAVDQALADGTLDDTNGGAS